VSNNTLRSIVIVGGGTAGWLAALLAKARLSKRLSNDVAPERSISVIVSPGTPIIGVGEGTTGLFTDTVRDNAVGLLEPEFIRETRATLKLGIRHRNWVKRGASYWGPTDNPYVHLPKLVHFELPILEASFCAAGVSPANAYLHTHLMRANKVPLFARSANRFISCSYGYHFDATCAAAYLEQVACGRGVQKIIGHVVHVNREADGNISSLMLRDGRHFSADFFIDCSGFARVLGQGNLEKWRSYGETLFADSAVISQVPHKPGPLPPYTQAIAMDAGWAWLIPTQDRLGAGYVYSSAFKTPEQAAAELGSLTKSERAPIRSLRFESGCVEEPWSFNHVAIGLAAGFLEPLEATSLHVTVMQLELLLNCLSKDPFIDPNLRQKYNDFFVDTMDSYRDFLLLHYMGGRRDTPFWRARSGQGESERVAYWTATWRQRFPKRSDVCNASGTINLNLVLPVAAGLGLLSAGNAQNAIRNLYASRLDPTDIQSRHTEILRELTTDALYHKRALQIMM
jgi:tryptophan halogenase